MLTIGEFSASTRLTAKALRLFHEEGILVPERVDPETGYRLYGEESWRRAQVVVLLQELGFSHREMKDILSACQDDLDLARHLERRLESVDRELVRMRRVRDRIALYLETGKETIMKEDREIRELRTAPTYACGIRFKGRYADVGVRFTELFKKVGRYCSGAPFCLYYDREFREDDADMEAMVPVRKEVSVPGIECRLLPEIRVLSLVHYGPYETIGETYRVLFDALRERSLEADSPCREIYRKGPGMILPRSPRKFQTEIQVPIRPKA